MVGINKGPIALNIETAFIFPQATLQPARLGKGACLGVIIQNRLTNDDGTGNPVELMIGKGNQQIYNMLPGQESPIIYAADLEEIYVRTRIAVAGDSTINYVVIVYKERQEGKK